MVCLILLWDVFICYYITGFGYRNDYFHLIVIDNLNSEIPSYIEGMEMLINFLISYSFLYI